MEQLEPAESVRDGAYPGFLSALSFKSPEKIVPSAWHEHAPFAFRLIEALKPKIVVELGAHNGFSHFAFCQGIRMAGLGAAAFAVDRWTGDEHAGFYGEEVFQSVSEYSNEHYADISNLMRMSFSDALNYFDDSSIDLLHIDGQHFYADVKANFESWLPKLSPNAVVLFHDINVREREFGVFRFWSEISRQYPNFGFLHGHGLGVLGVGQNLPPTLSALLEANEAETASIRNAYARLGSAVTVAFRASEATARFDAARREAEALRGEHAAVEKRIEDLAAEHARLIAEAELATASQKGEAERIGAELEAERRKAAEQAEQIAESERRLQGAFAELEDSRRLSEAAMAEAARENSALRSENQGLRQEVQDLGDEQAQSRAKAERTAAAQQDELARLAVALSVERQKTAELRDNLAEAQEGLENVRSERARQKAQMDGALRKVDLLTQDIASANSERIHAERAAHDLARNVRRLDLERQELLARISAVEEEKRALAELNERTAAEAARRQHNFETDSVHHFAEVVRLSSDLSEARAEFGRVERGKAEQAAEITALRARLVDAEAEAARAAARDKAPALAIVAEPFRRLWRAWALKKSGLFDPVFYRAHYPECEAMGLSPFKHYVTLGFARGHKPNEFFDSHWYLEQYEDVRRSGANPLVHYWLHGWKEGRDPGPGFSTEKYLDAYPDVRAAQKNPLAHYLLHGMREARAPKGTGP